MCWKNRKWLDRGVEWDEDQRSPAERWAGLVGGGSGRARWNSLEASVGVLMNGDYERHLSHPSVMARLRCWKGSRKYP